MYARRLGRTSRPHLPVGKRALTVRTPAPGLGGSHIRPTEVKHAVSSMDRRAGRDRGLWQRDDDGDAELRAAGTDSGADAGWWKHGHGSRRSQWIDDVRSGD